MKMRGPGKGLEKDSPYGTMFDAFWFQLESPKPFKVELSPRCRVSGAFEKGTKMNAKTVKKLSWLPTIHDTPCVGYVRFKDDALAICKTREGMRCFARSYVDMAHPYKVVCESMSVERPTRS